MSASSQPANVRDALSRLKAEIALNRDFTGLQEAAFLALVWTFDRLDELGRIFFAGYGITSAQFNALMILWDYRDRTMRQHQLAELLVVNRASMGGVLERMERNGWIIRTIDPEDRRAQRVTLSAAGIAKLNEVRDPYYRLLSQVLRDGPKERMYEPIMFFDRMRPRIESVKSTLGRTPPVSSR
jgi:DNA-binding MarR family transcriptional regulator